jgi:iron complex transport system ATP-binding protein
VAARDREKGLAVKLEASHLDFGYGARIVGRDVSLSVRAGEVLCLLGPNGSGKTTLFKTLLGLLPAQGGEVRIDDRDLRARARDEVARLVSYVPQAHAAFFPFTVEEVVLMGRTAHLGLFSSPSRRDREAAHAAIERMQIEHLADSIYTRISGGERQLALIARALAQEARVAVMDEPTANLDFGNQVRVLQHIQALARSGIGVLLSTHDPDHAFICADRVAMLHDGRLARLGVPAATITPDSLREIYGVEVAVVRVPVGDGVERPVCIPGSALSGAPH